MTRYFYIFKWLVAFVFAMAVLWVSGSLAYEIYRINMAYAKVTDVPSDWSFGPEDASVTIVEYFDYTCDFCKVGHDALSEALLHHDDVRVILKPFAIVDKEKSPVIAKFVMAAAYQGRFVELHNAILAQGLPVTVEEAKAIAQRLGLDTAKMEEDAKSEAIAKRVKNNIDEGILMSVNAVPSYLIEDALYIGLRGREPTAEAFDLIISEKKKSK